MSGQKQNLIPNEPELLDLLQLLKKDILLNLTGHHVGTIEKFNALKQTADVSINYKKTFFQPNAVTGDYDAVLADYPILLDCPVMFLGGGNGSLRFPVKKGDECLVCFNDRDLDNWFQGGAGSATNTLRLHSISDGIALVGIRSLANVLKTFSADKTQLQHDKSLVSLEDDKVRTVWNKTESIAIGVTSDTVGASLAYGTDTVVAAKQTKVLIKNSSKNLRVITQTLVDKLTDLNSALSTLVTQTAAITVTCSSPGSPSSPPINAAAIAAVSSNISAVTTALATIKTDLGVLLE